MTLLGWSRASVAVGVAAVSGWIVVGASAATVPNPCTILPGSTISGTVGLKGVTLQGKVSTRPDGPVKQSLCTFKHAGATLEIMIAPHEASGGSGGPPGMVITKPSGLGTGATFVHDENPAYTFANAYFTKGNFDAGVWDNGKLPNADILTLARKLYAQLA